MIKSNHTNYVNKCKPYNLICLQKYQVQLYCQVTCLRRSKYITLKYCFKVRDTPLSITAEEIVKLKEMAARHQEFTEEVIPEMKKKIWVEAEQVVKYLKNEAEKGIWLLQISLLFRVIPLIY